MGLWQQIGVAHLGLKMVLKCTTTTDSNMFNSVQQLVTGFDNLSTNDLIVYGIVSGIIYARVSGQTADDDDDDNNNNKKKKKSGDTFARYDSAHVESH